MSSINGGVVIKCPITVKAVVTDDLKSKMAAEVSEKIKSADAEIQQLELQAVKIVSEQTNNNVHAMMQQIEIEKQKRMELKNTMRGKLEERANLELVSEVSLGTVERLVTIMIGSDIKEIMMSEILVEDDKVIAFRG
jgi:hypothetical protein